MSKGERYAIQNFRRIASGGVCTFGKGEEITCEAGSMSWMDDGIKMETKAGSLGKMFGRSVNYSAIE